MNLTKKILKEMLEINSTKHREGEIGKYIMSLFYNKGYTIQAFDVPILNQETINKSCNESFNRKNIWIAKGNPKLFFFGHQDTVKPDKELYSENEIPKVVESDGKIYGLGSVDMKGGIAAFIAATLECNPENIGLVFTCDEEYEFEGIKNFTKSDLLKDYFPKLVVFAEPTDLEIVNKHRACYEFHIKVKGESAHAAKPELGRDASKLYLALCETRRELMSNYPGSNLNIGQFISGNNETINKVSVCADADIDVRPSDELYSKGPDHILNIIRKNVSDQNLITEKTSININAPPLNTPLIELKILEKIVSDTGINTKFSELIGTSEAGYISTKYNFSCVNFGPGPQIMSHKEGEYVSLDSLEKCLKVYINLIEKYDNHL